MSLAFSIAGSAVVSLLRSHGTDRRGSTPLSIARIDTYRGSRTGRAGEAQERWGNACQNRAFSRTPGSQGSLRPGITLASVDSREHSPGNPSRAFRRDLTDHRLPSGPHRL